VAAAYGRKGKEQPVPLADVNLRLTWLAQRMDEHGQTLFLLEQMQPSWLLSAWERGVYVLISRMVGFIVLLTAPMVLALPVLWGAVGWGPFELLYYMAIWFPLGLTIWFPLGLTIWFPLGLLCTARDLSAFEWQRRRSRRVVRQKPGALVSLGLNALLLYVRLFELICFNLFWLRSRKRDFTTDIQPVEHVTVSWSRAWRAASKGARWGAYFSVTTSILMVILIVTLFNGDIGSFGMLMASYAVFSLLLFGLAGALMTGIFSLVQARTVETKRRPNQGIHLSIRSACLLAAAMGGPVLLAAVGFSLAGSEQTGGFLVLVALYLATAGFLAFGGQDAIQHGVLRMILVRQRYIPRRYDGFLDHSVRLVLLQKVGGGYRFVHRLLQDYFAREISRPPVPGSS
jgi:hypothetical protein